MNYLLNRIVLALVGFAIIGFSIALLRLVELGIDPFGAMNLGLSAITGMSFGTLLLISNVPLFILMFVKKRELIGVGTVIGMFGVGYIIDFFYLLLSGVVDATSFSLMIRVLLLVIALVVLAIGASSYMTANIGMVPYDAFGIVIEELTHKRVSFKWARIGQDFFCAVVAFVLGATIGIATLLTVVCIGPLVSFFRGKFDTLINALHKREEQR